MNLEERKAEFRIRAGHRRTTRDQGRQIGGRAFLCLYQNLCHSCATTFAMAFATTFPITLAITFAHKTFPQKGTPPPLRSQRLEYFQPPKDGKIALWLATNGWIPDF